MEIQKNHQLRPGTILDGRYEIGPVLGEGGFGITYSGTHISTGEKVAVKELFCRDYMYRDVNTTGRIVVTEDTSGKRLEAERRRFLKEARIVRDLASEDSIVSVLDYFEENETAYIVMEFIEGITLQQYVKENGRFDPKELYSEMRPLMQALFRMHKAGVIHRDISPDNIIRTEDGHLVLIDFGSAKRVSARTQTTSAVFKDGYAPPEQYRPGAEAFPSLDVYSLCATMYYCLTGVTPEGSLHRALVDELKPVDEHVPVPKEVSRIIAKGMSLHQKDRQKDLDELIAGFDEVYPYITPEEAALIHRKKLRRIRIIAAVILLAVAAAAIHVIANLTEYRMKFQETLITHYSWEGNVDREAMSEIIRGRVEAFAGKNNYLFTETEDEIIVEMPLDLLGRMNPDYLAENYFAAGFEWMHLCDGSVEKPSIYGEDSVQIKPADIREADISEDEIPCGSGTTVRAKHLRVVLADREEGYGRLLNERGALLYLTTDNNPSTKLYPLRTYGYSEGDGKTFHILESCALNEEQYNDLVSRGKEAISEVAEIEADQEEGTGDFYSAMQRILTQKDVKTARYYNELIVDWEEPDANTGGKNQCAESKIKGKSVLISYDTGLLPDDASGMAKTMTGLRARLDSLKVPYAIGWDRYIRNDRIIVFKFASEDILQSETMLLGAPSFPEITNGIKDASIYGDLSINDDSTINVEITSSAREEFASLIAQNNKDKFDHVYLKCNEVPIAYTETEKAADALTSGTVVFDHLCTEDLEEDEERRGRHLGFIKSVLNEHLDGSMLLIKLENRSSNGTLENHGSYSTLKGNCFGPVTELTDNIEDDIGCETSAVYSVTGMQLTIRKDDLNAAYFEKEAADIIDHVMTVYSLYNDDVQIRTVEFRLSDEATAGAGAAVSELTSIYITSPYSFSDIDEINYVCNGSIYSINNVLTEESPLLKKQREKVY